MTRYGIIYIWTCHVNGMQYVGLTIQDENRYLPKHILAALNGSEKLFHKAVREHGPENFTFEIVYTAFDKEELDRAEDYFIVDYGTLVPDGYNRRRGGHNGPLSEETKLAIRIIVNSPAAKAKRAATDATPETKEKRRVAGIKRMAAVDLVEFGRKISAAMTPEGLLRTQAPEVKNRRYATLALTNSLPEVKDRRTQAQLINQNKPDVKDRVARRTREALSDPNTRAQMSSTHTGMRWINNGVIEYSILKDATVPEGFSFGRIPNEKGLDLRILALRKVHHRNHLKRGVTVPTCIWCCGTPFE
jgi:group I intron endonuclease